jgi:hypothetical protein
MLRHLAALAFALTLTACAGTSSPTEPAATSDASATEAATPDPTETASAPVEHVLAASPNPELREELLAMMAEDQAVRTGVAPPGDDRTADELFAAWPQVDADNALRMAEILDEFGWPGWSLVGEDGALAAWVLIQHADFNLDLQKRGLALMREAVAADDADPSDLAYLIDRVLVAEGKPQVYGTQLSVDEDGEVTPRTPIEDEANVDARRAEMGLGTLEAYYEEFREAVEAEP